ncbi:uncharacterized protein BBA_10227 [Beauveria bassiana ARSEF 2860]|uniref:Uncharacterized protein n=1 Tax=Beauveria bassiana (strain ARSEF 2860) TaxID=655819 RepID=J4KKP7_BEAB2|nr:uncharacterized protein BBA_10227 [Beauveria bassiana ARSEF 2860]EJP60824.1 hypothetical protein BBA_10227 [Beauveria bassiana ARSEF 2860]
MFILQRAFLLGLAAASLVTSRATGYAPDHGQILKRGVPERQRDMRAPEEIVIGSDTWKREDILAAIKNPVNPPKPFGNHGVEWKGNKWVPKKNLFEGVGAKLTEIDLTKNPSVRGKFRAIVTANKNFVGITEHAADNNVKSGWDVKALTREGKWIKLGDIAAAMQSHAKERRDDTKRDCGPGDIRESEVEDKVTGPERKNWPAEAGKQVESPPIEGEEPPSEPAPAEKELQKVQKPAEQLLKDSQAARTGAEIATSVKDVEAARAKADTALKALHNIAQQTVEYMIKYNDWMFIEDNLKPFRLYNQARVNLLLTSLRADEKMVEDYKTKFDESVKEPVSDNEVTTEAEKFASNIKQVVDKVQKGLETKTALKSNPNSFPPLQLGKLNHRDVFVLHKLEAKVLESEVSATEKGLANEMDKGDMDKGDKDKEVKDKEVKDKEVKNKNKERDSGNKEPEKGQDNDKKEDGKMLAKIRTRERTTAAMSKTATRKREQIKTAQDLEKGSGSGWVSKTLGGIAVTAGTLIGDGGLSQAAMVTGATGIDGAALTGSFAVGGVTVFSAPVSLEVIAAEVDAVLEEILPGVCNDAIGEVSVLARKRQEGDSPELRRWRVAAVALLAQQAIEDSLEEAFKQAQQEIGSK